MTNRSKFQQNVIRNYYDNRDAIALQRAQELVTELYLSTGKGRQRHWKTLRVHLEKLLQNSLRQSIQQESNHANLNHRSAIGD